jgi:hypothetical protein
MRSLYIGERESDQTSGATVGHRPRQLGTGASSLVGALGNRAVPGGIEAEGHAALISEILIPAQP